MLAARRQDMKTWTRQIFQSALAAACAVLTACTTDHGTIYQSAYNTVQRLAIGPIAEYDYKTLPHALDAGGGTFGPIASQYRWVHVQGITKVDRDTWLHTIARVPDQIPQLHKNDVVDVLFMTVSDSNYDQFKTSIVLRLVCKNEDTACKRQLYKDAGNTNVFFGPTGEAPPDTSQYTGCGANYGRERKTAYSRLHHRAERTAFQIAGAVVSLMRNRARLN
jgi:hypothetical protein